MMIRPYKNTDRPSVIDLWASVFGDALDHNAPEASLERKLQFGDQLLFVAAHGSGVVGTVMGGYDGHRGWVYSLAVHPDYRRQGIATKLMRYLESHLEQLGCPKLNLQVRATNREVLSFYANLGYQVEERISMGKRLHDE